MGGKEKEEGGKAAKGAVLQVRGLSPMHPPCALSLPCVNTQLQPPPAAALAAMRVGCRRSYGWGHVGLGRSCRRGPHAHAVLEVSSMHIAGEVARACAPAASTSHPAASAHAMRGLLACGACRVLQRLHHMLEGTRWLLSGFMCAQLQRLRWNRR